MAEKTPISKFGKVKFIEHITEKFDIAYDDAAVIGRGKKKQVVSVCTMLEGIDFSLEYFPLKHLGFKSVTKAVSNIYAMNANPESIVVAIGLSRRFMVEDVELFYEGVEAGCKYYGVKLVGGNTSPSLTGFTISLTCMGSVDAKKCVSRSGAAVNNLICLSAGLGSAFMGLKILERERRVLRDNAGVKPMLDGYDRVLSAYLQPFAANDTVKMLDEAQVVPTAMIDLTSGLASGILNLCHANKLGARIYLEKIPIPSEVSVVAEELNIDPLIAVLNGGDDYELLFSVSADDYERIKGHVDVIGYFTKEEDGAFIVTPENRTLSISSPDFTQVD